MIHFSDEKIEKILELAVPSTLETVLQALVGFFDTLMISRLGLVAVTAVGVSGNIFAVYLAVIIALGTGTSSLISRKLGAKDVDSARKYAMQATLLAVGIGLILGLFSLGFSRPLLQLMGADPNVIEAAYPYFRIVGGTTFFVALLTVFGSILRATGDARTPLWVNGLVNILNIVLDYILIFGMGPIPALGILGTALGTVMARGIGSIGLFLSIRKTPVAFHLRDLREITRDAELIRLSVPAVLERLVMRLGQVLYFGLIMSIGMKTYAAHTIAGSIESFSYMPAYGLATAASVLVGNSIGAGRRRDAWEYGMLSVKTGVLVMSLGGLILFLGCPWFASWFTQDGEAVGKIVTALRIDAFAQIPLAFSLILAGALQGSGDTKTPLYSTMLGMWGIRVTGVWVLGIQLGLDIAGVWLAILIDLSIRSVFLYFRFRQRTETGTQETS